jgi:ATP-binding cassette subfamily B protein
MMMQRRGGGGGGHGPMGAMGGGEKATDFKGTMGELGRYLGE